MDLLDQVRAAIRAHELFLPGETVVVAVSGGPDSLALLHGLHALSRSLDLRLHVAHLNHRLRGPESDADAQFVVELAAAWGLPATVEARDVATLAHAARLSIEEAARQARYRFLVQVAVGIGARAVVTGHHAGDQVETVVMHFLRGAGLAGLAGMRPRTAVSASLQPPGANVEIIRPLLGVTRADITSYCSAHALTPREDRSNRDTRLFRNRLRHEIIPQLETLNPNLRQVLLHTSYVLADDYAYLQKQVQAAYGAVTTPHPGAVVFARDAWRALDPALQRGTLRAAVRTLRRDLRDVDWTPVEDARRVALDRGAGAQATLPHGLALTVGYAEFVIADATYVPPAADEPVLNLERLELPDEGRVDLPGSAWSVETERVDTVPAEFERWVVFLDAGRLAAPLALRRRHPGDRFAPAGMGGHTQSLHEFMIDCKIPRSAREGWPLLVAGDEIVWVCGWRVAEGARTNSATTAFRRVALAVR